MIRRTVIVAAATFSVIAAPGIALADTNPQSTAAHQCFTHPELCAEPTDSNLDGSFVVVKGPSAWDKFRAIAGHALADIIFGPQW